ncbi:unnamed protein product [Alopecurus aequalis]
MAPTTPAVVDTRYCATHAMAFTVTALSWNNFAVKDARGVAVMEIVPSYFFHTYGFVDVSAPPRRPMLTVQRLPSLFDVGRSWEAYRYMSTHRSNLLFVAVKVPSLFAWADIHVHLAGRGERDDPDFVVTTIPGFFSSCDCTVSRAAVARIRRTVLFGWVSYDVSVKAGVDHAFILALTAILEDIRRDDVQRKRNRT